MRAGDPVRVWIDGWRAAEFVRTIERGRRAGCYQVLVFVPTLHLRASDTRPVEYAGRVIGALRKVVVEPDHCVSVPVAD